MALIEALIDFGEDENIEDDVYDNGTDTIIYFIFLGNCEQSLTLILISILSCRQSEGTL